MKQLASWRGARIASLVPNVLPKAEAAACIGARSCWCSSGEYADCVGTLYCTSCHGGIVNTGDGCVGC